MEVHHHPHVENPAHGGTGKNFKEYFLEFLMIFLAVTLGFIAENLREHNADKEKEEVYIKNLYEDLKTDTVLYTNYAASGKEFGDDIDSIMTLMKSSDSNTHLGKIYFYARIITVKPSVIFPNQRTFTQLKNSGQLRLITSQKVANDISSYYLAIDDVLAQNNFILSQISQYWLTVGGLFDAGILYKIRQQKEPPEGNPALLTNDPVMINKFLSSAQYFYGSRETQDIRVAALLENAKALLSLLKKEYHLKDE